MSNPKNLLFVFADQWRADAMGYAHADPVMTPNMDAFCAESTYCDHAFSTFPLCSPHRASLLTGKYPLSCGFFTNCKPGISMRLKDDEYCISEALAAAGYQTAYIGKWHLDEPEVNHDPAPASGARNWDAFTPPGPRRHGFEYWYSYGTYDVHLNPHYWADSPEMICPGKWSVEHETDKAIEYMSSIRDREKPFALFVSWNPPHSPYAQVPDKYLNLYPDVSLKDNVLIDNIRHHTGEEVNYDEDQMRLTTRQYYAAVSGLDDQFGRLIDYLKAEGLYESTVIVLSSDHGDMMGSHGMMGKHVWFEESIRIPFVVRAGSSQKKYCRTCIGSQDMAPTLLGLLNLSVPASFEGDDCSGYIMTDSENPDRVSYLCACPGRDVFIKEFTANDKNPLAYGWRGVRTQTHTYVMELGYEVIPSPARYLYSIVDDPQQMNPLDLSCPANRALAEKLEADVLAWMNRQKDLFADNWLKNADIL